MGGFSARHKQKRKEIANKITLLPSISNNDLNNCSSSGPVVSREGNEGAAGAPCSGSSCGSAQARSGLVGRAVRRRGTRAAVGPAVSLSPPLLSAGPPGVGPVGAPPLAGTPGTGRAVRLLSLGARCAAGAVSGTCEPQPVS